MDIKTKKEIIWGQAQVEEVNDNNTKEPKILEVVRNRIYFYSEIERDKVLVLNSKIREMDNRHISSKEELGIEFLTPIYLHINSYGGSIFHGLSGMDNILNCKSDIITVVDGVCASAATFLSVVGTKRLMTKHSFMLIHQLSSAFWGKYNEFKDLKINLDLFMETIKGIYNEYTSVPENKISEILDHDLYFDSKNCLKYGLVDEVI